MKKKLLWVLISFYLFTCLPLHADEGMWTLYNLPQAVYNQMKGEGFALPYAHFTIITTPSRTALSTSLASVRALLSVPTDSFSPTTTVVLRPFEATLP